jgi:enoyl-CoA hydratase/carnithine racemase
MSEPELVRYEVSNGIATLTLSRPERRNAWTAVLETQYFERLFDASADPSVRVVVLTGDPEGGAFCPGLDTGDLNKISSDRTALTRDRWSHTMLTRVPKPTIAAINGACAGMGLVHALYCDVRFAQTGSNFTTAFARRGLPAENASAWALSRLVGVGAAADLLLSGRKFGADEALALGVINRLVEPDELMASVYEYAGDISANCSPGALAQIKHQLYEALQQSMEPARLLSLEYLYEKRLYDDFAEGVQSYIEKRPPQFPGIAFDLLGSETMDELSG